MKLLEWWGDVYQVPDWVDYFTWELAWEEGRFDRWFEYPEYAEPLEATDPRVIEYLRDLDAQWERLGEILRKQNAKST